MSENNISNPTQKVSRPNISGSGGYVTKVDVSKHLAIHEEKLKAEAKAREVYVSPEEAQENHIQYLTRAVKALQKELKALKEQP